MALSEAAERIYAQAVHYYNMGRYEQAKNQFVKVLSEEPEHDDSLLLVGMCCSLLGDHDAAYNYCKQAFAAGQNTELGYEIMTLVLMGRHEYAEAERVILRGLEVYSENASLIGLYALVMVKTGFMKKARQLLKDAKQIEPTNERVLSTEFVMEMVRFHAKAADDIARMFWEYGRDPIANHLALGGAAMLRRKFREAREHYREAFVLDPTNAETLKTLSELDQLCHPLCWPNMLFEKLQLPYTFLGLFVIAMVSVILFGPASILVVGAAYLALKVYTRFSGRLYRFWQTRRGVS